MKKKTMTQALLVAALLLSHVSFSAEPTNKTSAPPLGWNSFDSYGTHINEALTHENLEAFIQKLKPHGYEYFVLDAGWFAHYDLKPGEVWPTEGDKRHLAIDAFGRFIPSEVLFPNGLEAIIERAHTNNLKFGLHLMRGIPRQAVELDLPIKGTNFTARDIADVNDICPWSDLMYGVDMDKPGAQAYYDSVMELLAGWGVDFIKYDDIVHKPKEINGVANAIENSGREMILSVSPGRAVNPEYYATYARAEMIRISHDIWDLQEDIDISFERWEEIFPYADRGFWLDMDMIPFGHIRINHPLSVNHLGAKRGYERMDNFSYAQKKTFITQRAMAASPLFMGGALATSPNIVFELITDEGMLACNQNGVTGELVTRIENYAQSVDVWKTSHKANANEGWFGVFNRNAYQEMIRLDKAQLGLEPSVTYHLYDIWGKRLIQDSSEILFEIPANDVAFVYFKPKPGH